MMGCKMRYMLLVIALIVAISPLAALAQSDEEKGDALIQIVASSETFVDWLEQYPNWHANAGPTEYGSIWYVEFYTENDDDWLGYATIDADSGEIQEAFAPVPLDPDVYQEQQAAAEKLIMDDPEVQARLDDPILWDVYSDYNRYEVTWDFYFYRGIDAILVKAKLEDDYFSIADILNPHELTEEQALEDARNEAISLAYSAPGIDTALDGHDDWSTYAEKQSESVWSVSFAAGEEALFYALVDVTLDKVLEAG